jgi:N-acetyl-gamma-glutamylphosphate reductase
MFCHELLRKKQAVIHYVANVAVPTAIRKSPNIMDFSNDFCTNESIYECKYKD